MNTIEALGISEKGVQACFGAKVNGFATIIGFWEISGIGFEDSLTEGVETLG